MTSTEDFIAAIDNYLERSGMSASGFGKAAVGDPNLVFDLRDGSRTVGLRLVDRVHEFIRSQEANVA